MLAAALQCPLRATVLQMNSSNSRRVRHTLPSSLTSTIFRLHTNTRFRYSAKRPIMAQTSRRTRSQKSADEGHRTPKFRDWLEAGGGIFIQQKPRANLQNLWENETSLAFSQDGPKPYTISVPNGESIELKLICNMNFDLNPAPEDNSEKTITVNITSKSASKTTVEEEAPSKDGDAWTKNMSRKGTLCYADIFYLTAKLSGLGRLEGPSTWTIFLFHDWSTDSLVVQATGRDGGKLILEKQLTLPLRLVPETHLRLYVDFDELEKRTPGAAKEQRGYITGTVDRHNGAHISNQKKTRGPKMGLFQPPVRPPELKDRKRG